MRRFQVSFGLTKEIVAGDRLLQAQLRLVAGPGAPSGALGGITSISLASWALNPATLRRVTSTACPIYVSLRCVNDCNYLRRSRRLAVIYPT
jgi:hypothetical protein